MTNDLSDRIDAGEMWEMICGENSLLNLFSRTHGLRLLVQDIVIETIASDQFEAIVMRDPDDGKSPMIRLSTACYEHMLQHARRLTKVAGDKGLYPWKALGWKIDAFSDTDEFSKYIAGVALDFMILHEISHIARGHAARYLAIEPMGMSECRGNEPDCLSKFRRLSLELDADSVAVYHMVTLRDHFFANAFLYRKFPNTSVYISTVSFSMSIVFHMLSRADRSSRRAAKRPRLLIDRHAGLRHPAPDIRAEFANHRILQLSSSVPERKEFQRALTRSNTLLRMLTAKDTAMDGNFEEWEHEPSEVADFINLLVDEISAAADEGWMYQGTPMSEALRALGDI